MDDSHQHWLEEALRRIRSRTSLVPRVAIILGSGLGEFAVAVEAEATFAYANIPGFPVSTAIGHKGQLTLGRFAGVAVAVMEGRFHIYEGYSADQVVRPVHLLRALGIETLIATNAAGGLNPNYIVGDVVAVEDHVNLMWSKPREDVSGKESSSSRLYDSSLIERALAASRRAGVRPQRGVYVAMTGPNYETRAEYRWLRQIGDLVGMSTVPEVLAARSLGMRVLALSVVSNACSPDSLEPTDGAHVVAAVSRAEGRLREIVRGVLQG